jgi:hypothetical protein
MFVLNSGDKLLGGASTAGLIDFTVHGLFGEDLTQLSDGQLGTAGTMYEAGTAIGIASVILVNTDASVQSVNMSLFGTSGTARLLIPKDLILNPNHSLHFEGGKAMVMGPSGNILSAGTSGSSGTSGQPDTGSGFTTVNFGTHGTSIPSQSANVVITGLTDMAVDSHINVFMVEDDSTADNGTAAHKNVAFFSTLSASDRVAGVGFTAHVRLRSGKALGTFKVHYIYL